MPCFQRVGWLFATPRSRASSVTPASVLSKNVVRPAGPHTGSAVVAGDPVLTALLESFRAGDGLARPADRVARPVDARVDGTRPLAERLVDRLAVDPERLDRERVAARLPLDRLVGFLGVAMQRFYPTVPLGTRRAASIVAAVRSVPKHPWMRVHPFASRDRRSPPRRGAPAGATALRVRHPKAHSAHPRATGPTAAARLGSQQQLPTCSGPRDREQRVKPRAVAPPSTPQGRSVDSANVCRS